MAPHFAWTYRTQTITVAANWGARQPFSTYLEEPRDSAVLDTLEAAQVPHGLGYPSGSLTWRDLGGPAPPVRTFDGGRKLS
jgi:hypothetical protein